MQPVAEASGDAEVAAAAADRPEQLRMGLGVHVEHLAVGGHQLRGQQVVDGQAVLANQVAGASARCSTSSTPSGSSRTTTLSQRSVGP
jgi:hypothetical protein